MLVREGEDYSIHLISKGELTLPLWNPLCSKPGLSVPLGGKGVLVPGGHRPGLTEAAAETEAPLKKLYFYAKEIPLPCQSGSGFC